MIRPETRLWNKLSEAVTDDLVTSLVRVETETHVGVADVEYVARKYHGWIELKTSSVQRESSKFTFHCPYTMNQYQWLSAHHRPQFYLRSWLLVGRLGPRTWREWFLIAPRPSLQLTQMRESPTLGHVRRMRGVYVVETATEVLQIIGR